MSIEVSKIVEEGLVSVHVNNSAGECSAKITPKGMEFFKTAPEGHYMLGVPGKSPEDDPDIASVTVRDGAPALYIERKPTELDVGEHMLTATRMVALAPKVAPPRPR